MFNSILAALDISDQIDRGLRMVRTIQNPLAAFILAAILGLINFALWPYIWFFDIDASRAWGQQHAQLIQTMETPVPVPDPAMIGMLLAIGLLLPTLIEMGAPVLSRYGIRIAAWLFWICIALDAYTDFPRVELFMQPYTPDVWYGWPIFWVARMVLLFFATIGLEFWFAVTSVIVLALVLRGVSLSAGRRVAQEH